MLTLHSGSVHYIICSGGLEGDGSLASFLGPVKFIKGGASIVHMRIGAPRFSS